MNELIRTESRSVGNQSISSEILKRFVEYLDTAPRTVETYSKNLRQFFKYLAENGITNPTRSDVLAYREALRTNCKPATVQSYIIAVRQFFKWTASEGIYPDIASNVKGAKLTREHKKDALTARQVKEILSKVERDTETGARDYAILTLLLTCGLRTIEVERAKIEDVRTLGDFTVLYIQGKGRDDKTEFVKLEPVVERAIRDYLRIRGKSAPSEPLFTSASNNSRGSGLTTRSISGTVKARFKDAGYDSERLTAHSLRHTAATINLLNGGTLEETQQLLRHTSLNTTQIYLHHLARINNQSERRIAEAIF